MYKYIVYLLIFSKDAVLSEDKLNVNKGHSDTLRLKDNRSFHKSNFIVPLSAKLREKNTFHIEYGCCNPVACYVCTENQ